jgi:hypothetical protein
MEQMRRDLWGEGCYNDTLPPQKVRGDQSDRG